MADDNDKRLLEEARKLPLDERVEHKNWKVRSEALDYIKQQVERAFSPVDPIFAEAGPLMRPLVGDTNANVMDKALEVLGAYLEKADEAQASRIAGPVSATIATKALKARPGTLAKANEVCMLFVELEQQAAVVEGIMKAFTDKVPKVVVAALDILTKAVSSFGTGVMDFRTILKGLPTVFGASNSDVRNKAKELTVELAAFLGRAVVEAALLEKMPAAMKKDVEALLAELPPGKRKPERYTRKEQAARGELPEGGAEPMEVDEEAPVAAAAVEEEDPGMDAYEFAPPKDILGPLAKDSVAVGDDKVPFWDCFESKKWAMRKKALERVREVATTTRLATGDYGDLVRELKRVLAKDANITCAAEAASVAGLLGTGLRKDFGSYAKQLVPPILERFKEKNIVMSKAAEESLRSLFEHCITVGEAAEDLVEACGHKNPKVRLDTVKLVKDVLEKTPKAQITKVQGSLLPVLANLAGDSDANIRDAAQGAMVVFAVKAGSMAVLDKVMTKLDDSRKKKIEEMVQEAVKAGPAGGRAKAGPAAVAASAALNRSGSGASSRSGASAAAPSKAANPPLAPKNTNRPSAMASIAAGGPKGGAGAPARRTTTGSSAGGAAKPRAAAAAGGGADDDDAAVSAPKMSNEELEHHMLEMFGGELVESLKSAKWQDRLEGMSTVLSKVEEQGESADPGLLIQAVGFLPGWGDKNFQVLNKLFELVALVAKVPSFNKREVVYAMEGLAEKVHEIKHKEKVFEALSLASEAAGPGFVMSLLHKKAAANKNPKVLSEALGWMAETVEAFGLGTMNVKNIIEWMKADLASASAPVRNKAMEVLGKCHAQLGPALNAFMEGLKPAQLTALEEVFRQNPQTEVVPTRKSRRGSRKAAPAGAAAPGADAAAEEEEEEEEAPAASLDDLLPRTDISGRITPSLLAMITSANWKERNAGVLEVEQILKEANSRIGPNVGELLPAMKGRLADSNRNLAAKALTVMADICRAMGAAFDNKGRQLLGPALANISDNKKVVRDSVLVLLDAWLTISPAEKLFPAVLEAIASPKCITDGKVTGLQWMAKVVSEGHASKAGDVAMRAVLLGTSDKAVAVREAGSGLLQELGKVLGRETLMQSCGTLDGPTKRSAQELIVKTFGGSLAGSGGGTIAASRPGTAASKAAEPPSRVAVRANSSRLAQVAAAAVGGGRGATAGGSGPGTPKAALLSLSHGKAERARKYRVRPGRFDGVNSEEQEILERELGAVASDELRVLLFAKDFKKHLDAADRLSAALPSLLEEVKAALDLLFRWVVVRICDGNMQSLVKVLELTKVILEALMDCGHSLTDYEAALLLPCVVEKSGHNQDRVRALHRDVMRLCCSLMSPAKVVDNLVMGLGSKNNRTKIECCEEIGAIVEREGMGPLLSSKAKPVAALATLLPERDGATRAAALITIELVWVEEGDGVWKLLGNLENRIREMVEDRLRRSKLQPKFQPPPPAATPSLRRPVTSQYPPAVEIPPPMYGRHAQSDSLEYARGGFTPPAPLDTPAPGRPAYGMPMAAGGSGMPPPAYAVPPVPQQPAYSALPTPVPPPRAPVLPDVPPFSGDEAAFREQWMHAMFGINSPDMREVVDNMKALCGDIMAVAMADGPAAAGCRAIMATSANELFSTINRLMPKLLDSAEHDAAMTGTAPSSRGCKYALNVLLQGIAVHEVSMALPQATLRETISLLLLLLLDERGLVNYEEGSTLMKAINVLMLKMLEATNRTYTFSALLQLLREPPPEIRPEQLPKFYDLVVKCLIKLTKSLQTSMEGLDLQELLFSVHDFFMALGVDEIRKRSSLDDKPLRMVKTILHELCKMKGYEIYEYAKNIPGRNSEPQPIIFAYIGLNLQTLQQTGLIQGPENGDAGGAMGASGAAAGGGGGGEDAQSKAAGMSSAEKAEVKSRLKDIMGRLMQPDQTAAAMEELYWLRREHSMYVEKYLSTAKVSESFQRYINDGLEEVEQRVAGGGGGGQPAAALHDGEEHHDQGGEEVGDSGAATPQRTVPRLTLGSGLPPRAAPSPAGSSRALGSTLGSAFGGSGALAAGGGGGLSGAGSGSFMVSPDRQGGQLSQRGSATGGAGESYMVSPGRAAGAGALSARSDGPQSARLSGVRERLSMLRMGGDGGSATLSSLLAGGGGGSGAGMGAPSPLSARSNVDVTNMRSSIEELQARMESLRRSQG